MSLLPIIDDFDDAEDIGCCRSGLNSRHEEMELESVNIISIVPILENSEGSSLISADSPSNEIVLDLILYSSKSKMLH